MVLPFILSTASRSLHALHRTSSSSSSSSAARAQFTGQYYPASFYSQHPLRNQPLSRSFFLFPFASSSSSSNMVGKVKDFVESAIDENDIVVFSKSWCPYCRKTKSRFSQLALDFKVFELDEIADGDEIQAYLAEKTGQRTVPSIFIKQKHIGGNSDLGNLSDGEIKSRASL